MKQLKNLLELKALSKNERKDYINKNGWFLKFECKMSTNKPEEVPAGFTIPEGTTYVEWVISTWELNMNWYKIDIRAWDEETIKNFFDVRNGLMYYQHDMDNVIGKTLWAWVIGDQLRIKSYLDDRLIEWRFATGLSRDFSTWHYSLEVVFENNSDGHRVDEQTFRDMENFIWETSETREELEDKLRVLYAEWTMVVTKLVWIEYSLVNVWANRSAKVKSGNTNNKISKTNSMQGILSHKWYNSLSTYILEMKKNNASLDEAKKKINSTEEIVEETTTEETIEEKKEVLPTDKDANEETEENNATVEEWAEEQEAVANDDGWKEAEDDSEAEGWKDDDSIETQKEVDEDLSTDDAESENEGEAPEVKENNSLGKQTIEVNIVDSEAFKEKVEELNKTFISELEKANNALSDAVEIISEKDKEIKKLNSIVEKAKNITIKNWILVETKEKTPRKLSAMEKKLNGFGY